MSNNSCLIAVSSEYLKKNNSRVKVKKVLIDANDIDQTALLTSCSQFVINTSCYNINAWQVLMRNNSEQLVIKVNSYHVSSKPGQSN